VVNTHCKGQVVMCSTISIANPGTETGYAIEDNYLRCAGEDQGAAPTEPAEGPNPGLACEGSPAGTDHERTLAEALRLCQAGFRPIPLEVRGKRPLQNGWQKSTGACETVEKAFRRYPDCNIGIVTGKSFFVLDVDPAHGGNESLASLLAQHGALPKTAKAITG